MSPCFPPARAVPTDASVPRVACESFSTHALPVDQQMLAWRGRVGHVVDAPPSRLQLAEGFGGCIDRYVAGGMMFTDVRTDAMVLERSIARVSTDTRQDVVFHLYLEGHGGCATGLQRKQREAASTPGIIAFDMGQPFRVDRPACRVLTLFVPRMLVDAGVPDGEALHGQSLARGTPSEALAWLHLQALVRELPRLSPQQAADAFATGAQLLLAAFHPGRVGGAGRAAWQVALMGQIRRFVDANLQREDLSPTDIVQAMGLKRATVYRWFEPMGGLGMYVRHRRLRMAAADLVRFPQLSVTDVAYGLGFKSASDFTRSFRRTFNMSPTDLRARSRELKLAGVSG